MILAAKVALAFSGTIAAAGMYTFHDGIAQVQIDDHSGTHVHIWAPAAIVPMALHIVPKRELHKLPREAQQFIPTLRVLVKELEKYPNTEFVEVGDRDSETHVRVRTVGSKVVVDVVDRDDKVHVVCPLAMVREMVDALEVVHDGKGNDDGDDDSDPAA
jgi:hypothetical protein